MITSDRRKFSDAAFSYYSEFSPVLNIYGYFFLDMSSVIINITPVTLLLILLMFIDTTAEYILNKCISNNIVVHSDRINYILIYD